MNYQKNDYIYVTFFEYFNRMNGRIYLRNFYNCWCKVIDADPEIKTYDVITKFGERFHKVPESAIHQYRTNSQKDKIRIKRLE